jgi:hypothetical protein
VVYTSPDLKAPFLGIGNAGHVDPIDFSGLLDANLLQAARYIYRTYYEVHPDEVQRPIGVAIDRFSYRGQLIFTRKPILLPQECFVPLSQIES